MGSEVDAIAACPPCPPTPAGPTPDTLSKAGRAGNGASAHVAGCDCTRCTGFPPGNALSLRHGAYASPVRLSAETDTLAEELAPLVPMATEADGPAVQLLALAFVRIGKAEPIIAAAEAVGDLSTVARLEERQRQWTGTATRLLDALGMTPSARAKLARDAAAGVASQAVLDSLLTKGRELRLGHSRELRVGG